MLNLFLHMQIVQVARLLQQHSTSILFYFNIFFSLLETVWSVFSFKTFRRVCEMCCTGVMGSAAPCQERQSAESHWSLKRRRTLRSPQPDKAASPTGLFLLSFPSPLYQFQIMDGLYCSDTQAVWDEEGNHAANMRIFYILWKYPTQNHMLSSHILL